MERRQLLPLMLTLGLGLNSGLYVLHASWFLLFPKNPSVYTSRDPAHLPQPCPLPPAVWMVSISAWLRNGAAASLNPERTSSISTSKCFGIRHS